MVNKEITKRFLLQHNAVDMVQPLPNGYNIFVTYHRAEPDKWIPIFSTDSTYHICPNIGVFMKCEDCWAYDKEDTDKMMEKCVSLWKKEFINDWEMLKRANECAQAKDCIIRFRSLEVK